MSASKVIIQTGIGPIEYDPMKMWENLEPDPFRFYTKDPHFERFESASNSSNNHRIKKRSK